MQELHRTVEAINICQREQHILWKKQGNCVVLDLKALQPQHTEVVAV